MLVTIKFGGQTVTLRLIWEAFCCKLQVDSSSFPIQIHMFLIFLYIGSNCGDKKCKITNYGSK